jgi:anhydro-N-acetylmuramic acid kinase
MNKIYKSIGLMSGTSMDGIDLALIESDGEKIIKRNNFAYLSYQQNFIDKLRFLINNKPSLEEIKLIEKELTIIHANFVNDFLGKNKILANQIDLISFHGHTILHKPQQKITWQIGDKLLLEKLTKIKVINQLRNIDIAQEGQGAPLVPAYHFYLLSNQEKPFVVLNIGGISNITYVKNSDELDMEGFDICFGNAPFDEIMLDRMKINFDENGKLAKQGTVNFEIANRILENKIFYKKPPKSFDRNDFLFLITEFEKIKIEDCLATLAYIHAIVVKKNIEMLDSKIKSIFICGGGRKNQTILEKMKNEMSDISIKTAEEIGLNGDSIEAEAFAFLAIRFIKNLPISFPKTTGRNKEIDNCLN